MAVWTPTPTDTHPPPAWPRPCTCLLQAAVGGRALAVRGAFLRRSHPVNPLGLDPTAPPASHLHCHPHHTASASPAQISYSYIMSKGGQCEIKGPVPCMLIPRLQTLVLQSSWIFRDQRKYQPQISRLCWKHYYFTSCQTICTCPNCRYL